MTKAVGFEEPDLGGCGPLKFCPAPGEERAPKPAAQEEQFSQAALELGACVEGGQQPSQAEGGRQDISTYLASSLEQLQRWHRIPIDREPACPGVGRLWAECLHMPLPFQLSHLCKVR